MGFLTLLNSFFVSGGFFLAGLGAATAPTVIHLLNRRRFRTLHWAAMDFLKEALQRNRRIMQIRDLILLIVRTFAILLIGLALARPIVTPASMYFWAIVFPCLLGITFFLVCAAALWSNSAVRWASLGLAALLIAIGGWGLVQQQQADPNLAQEYDGAQPIHAVLLIDNSLSMGYQTALEGTLLDRAKSKASEYIRALPQGSRVSIIPVCGPSSLLSIDPYTQDDAMAALQRIEVVDRSVSLASATAAASQAMEAGPLMSRRVVLLGDQQANNWRDATPQDLEKFGGLQVVDVSVPDAENSWIADFHVQDGLADVETPAVFVAQLRHSGRSPRRDVQVTLQVDGVDVASKTVSLQPGDGAREVSFSHVFHAHHPEPGKPFMAPVTVRLTPDNLPADDERSLIVPVVAALPVVFVDQVGSREDDTQGQIGETRSLRRLLSPGEGERRLIDIRHLTIDQLSRDQLADARLVVIAGVKDPGGAVDLLRSYVEQGGPLVIAAGGDFDPAAWNSLAWRDGEGVLPAPLATAPLGQEPEEAGADLRPFYLSFESLSWHPYFQLAEVSEEDLRELYAEPFFFKAVRVDVSSEALAVQKTQEEKRLREQMEVAQQDDPEASVSTDPLRWLLWESPDTQGQTAPTDEAELQRRVEQSVARPLARFAAYKKAPFMVQRQIGGGEVLFVASGVQSSWNTMPRTNTILIFDRILRSLIRSTLPRRTLTPQERIAFALPPQRTNVTVALQRPGDEAATEPLDVGFIGQDRRGVQVTNAIDRGLYTLVSAEDAPQQIGAQQAWEVFAVNGPAEESELTTLTSEQFAERAAGVETFWVGRGQAISLAGEQQYAQNLWWWLALAVLTLLLFEITLLSASAYRSRPAESPTPATA